MRIMMLVADFQPVVFGGIGTYASEMTKELVRLGHEVDVFVVPVSNSRITKNYTYEEKYGECGVQRIYRFQGEDLEPEWEYLHGGTRYNLLWAHSNSTLMPPILKIAVEREYDVIHTHDFFGFPIACAVRETLNIPIVNTVHASGYHAQALSFQLRKYICLMADRNIIASKFLKNAISLDPHLREIRYKTVYGGVSFREESMGEIIEENHDVLMAGMVKRSKGCFMLLKAYLELMKTGEIPSDSRLLFAGTGEDLGKLKAYVQEEHLEDRVVCLGHLEYAKVRELMHRVCVVAALGQHEAFGLTALEAMAENTPVIASDFGGFTEYLTSETDSLLADPFSVQAIKAALKRVLNDKALRMRLIENGAATARKWSWAHTARDSAAIYQAAMEEWKANGNKTICHQQSLKKVKPQFDLRRFIEEDTET